MKDAPSVRRRRAIASVDLGELKLQAEQRSAAAGLTLSAWLRPLVQRALTDHEPTGEPSASPSTAMPEGPARRLWMDPDLAAQVDAMCQAGGFRTRVALLRALLAGHRGTTSDVASHLGDAITQLTTSNFQLVGLGRNLNQIAKSLNTYPGKTTLAERRAIEQAVETIRAHLELSARVVGDLRPLIRTPKPTSKAPVRRRPRGKEVMHG